MKRILSIFIALFSAVAIAAISFIPAFAAKPDKDGAYTVDVYLVQKDKDKETPASDGVLKQAKIIVKDGKSTMYIYTQPVTVVGQTSTLQGLRVFKTADATDEGTEAKIVSKNSQGQPNCFSFELPHTNEFLRIQVDTGLKIPGIIGARLKVDWASLKLVKEYTTKPATTVPATTKPADKDSTSTGTEETTAPDTTNVTDETTTVAEPSTEAAADDVTNEEIGEPDDIADDFLKAPEEANIPAADTSSPALTVIAASSAVTALALVIIAINVVVFVKRKK